MSKKNFKVSDGAGGQVDNYRFDTGSLFEFSKDHSAYIHCWKNPYDNTMDKAIKSYENYLEADEFQ